MFRSRLEKPLVGLSHRASPYLTAAQQEKVLNSLEVKEECLTLIHADAYGSYLRTPVATRWVRNARPTAACIIQNHGTVTYHLKVFQYPPDDDGRGSRERQADLLADFKLFAGGRIQLVHHPTCSEPMLCFPGRKYSLGVLPTDAREECRAFAVTALTICGVWLLDGAARPLEPRAVDRAVRRMKRESLRAAEVSSKGRPERAARIETGWIRPKASSSGRASSDCFTPAHPPPSSPSKTSLPHQSSPPAPPSETNRLHPPPPSVLAWPAPGEPAVEQLARTKSSSKLSKMQRKPPVGAESQGPTSGGLRKSFGSGLRRIGSFIRDSVSPAARSRSLVLQKVQQQDMPCPAPPPPASEPFALQVLE